MEDWYGPTWNVLIHSKLKGEMKILAGGAGGDGGAEEGEERGRGERVKRGVKIWMIQHNF